MNHLNKYLDMPKKFYGIAVEADIACKQVERATKELIPRARGDEQLSDYLMKVCELYEKTDKLITDTKALLQEIGYDCKAVMEGADIRNKMREHLDMIDVLIHQREQLITQLNEAIRTTRTTQQPA
jgi:hypothetical protein